MRAGSNVHRGRCSGMERPEEMERPGTWNIIRHSGRRLDPFGLWSCGVAASPGLELKLPN